MTQQPVSSFPPQALAIAQVIDHTKLAFAQDEEPLQAIQQLCEEAKTYGFYAVCVRPDFISIAKGCLSGTPVKVATVIGFPEAPVPLERERQHATIGDIPLSRKLAEVQESLAAGADELDLVLNIRQFQAEASTGSFPQTLQELKAIQQAAAGRPVKVILETDLLSSPQIIQATACCAEAGVAMVKTSTGFVQRGEGATVAHVALMRKTLADLGKPLGIKASGGVRDAEKAIAMLNAGATRIGTSAGIAILQACQSTSR